MRDLTAALGTVDHDLLLLHLERQFDLRGFVLQWFSREVILSVVNSVHCVFSCSVPAGSVVLCQQLFVLYTAALADIVTTHDVNLHALADVTELYIHCHRGEISVTVHWLERYITEVGHWTSANHHKLNADKTELCWAGSKHGLASLGVN